MALATAVYSHSRITISYAAQPRQRTAKGGQAVAALELVQEASPSFGSGIGSGDESHDVAVPRFRGFSERLEQMPDFPEYKPRLHTVQQALAKSLAETQSGRSLGTGVTADRRSPGGTGALGAFRYEIT